MFEPMSVFTTEESSFDSFDQVFSVDHLHENLIPNNLLPRKRVRNPVRVIPIKKPKSNKKEKREEYINNLSAREAMEYKYGLIPRIIKSDIRRQYAIMFANVQNSCNFDTMTDFLYTYSRHDFNLLFHKQGMAGLSPSTFEVKGIEPSGSVWFASCYDCADLVFNISDNKIILRADNTAMVTARFSLSGTKVVDRSSIIPQKHSFIHSKHLRKFIQQIKVIGELESAMKEFLTNVTMSSKNENFPFISSSFLNNKPNLSPNLTSNFTPIISQQTSSQNPTSSYDLFQEDIDTLQKSLQVFQGLMSTTKEMNYYTHLKVIETLMGSTVQMNSDFPIRYLTKHTFQQVFEEPLPSDPICVPFVAVGYLNIHIDEDSKVFMVNYNVDASIEGYLDSKEINCSSLKK